MAPLHPPHAVQAVREASWCLTLHLQQGLTLSLVLIGDISTTHHVQQQIDLLLVDLHLPHLRLALLAGLLALLLLLGCRGGQEVR